MRTASLSLFLYSLSLVAIAAGQGGSTQVTDVVTTDGPDSTTTTPTAIPTSDTNSNSDTSTTSSTSTTEEPTTTPEPTTTTSTASTTTHSTTESTTSSSTTSKSTTSSDTSTEETPTATVTTITSTEIISGTPVPTTFTSSAESSSATESPGLSGADKGSGSSGLSDSSKKIIIGVVVGVGGAILIGAIGVVAWRLRARRRNAQENDDVADLMSGTAVGAGAREKAPSPGAGGTPFKSTLDQYHNPGPVNAASNF